MTDSEGQARRCCILGKFPMKYVGLPIICDRRLSKAELSDSAEKDSKEVANLEMWSSVLWCKSYKYTHVHHEFLLAI